MATWAVVSGGLTAVGHLHTHTQSIILVSKMVIQYQKTVSSSVAGSGCQAVVAASERKEKERWNWQKSCTPKQFAVFVDCGGGKNKKVLCTVCLCVCVLPVMLMIMIVTALYKCREGRTYMEFICGWEKWLSRGSDKMPESEWVGELVCHWANDRKVPARKGGGRKFD